MRRQEKKCHSIWRERRPLPSAVSEIVCYDVAGTAPWHAHYIYMTSTKNSHGLPIAMRKDWRLPDKSSFDFTPATPDCPLRTELPCWGGVVVVVATDCSEPLDLLRLPPDRRLRPCARSSVSLAELPPDFKTSGFPAVSFTQRCSDPLLLPAEKKSPKEMLKHKRGSSEQKNRSIRYDDIVAIFQALLGRPVRF